jgi:hypothetical protein
MEPTFRNPKLYFISGKARSGKDVIATFLKEEYEQTGKKVAIMAYAKQLRFYCREYFGWDGNEDHKPRELFNELGYLIRDKLNKKHLIANRLMEDIEILSYYFDVIITDDARLPFELDIPKSKFPEMVSIRINRTVNINNLTEEYKHSIMETSLDNYENFKYIIDNDGTLEDLREKVKGIIRKEEE